MQIPISIETFDRDLAFAFAGEDGVLRADTPVHAPGAAAVTYEGSLIRKGIEFPEVVKLVVDVTIAIDTGLFSAWLYDVLKGRSVEKVVINRRIITEITKDGIRQVIDEEIRRGG